MDIYNFNGNWKEHYIKQAGEHSMGVGVVVTTC